MTEMPASRQASRKASLSSSLLPAWNPPPWMNTTSGVGSDDGAFHRSSTFRSWGPYLTPIKRSGLRLAWDSPTGGARRGGGAEKWGQKGTDGGGRLVFLRGPPEWRGAGGPVGGGCKPSTATLRSEGILVKNSVQHNPAPMVEP